MSCSPEILNWLEMCYKEEEDKISFTKDIEGKEKKIHFSYTNHLKKNLPDYRIGYKLSSDLPWRPPRCKVNWTNSMICNYDPRKENIMYEIDEGNEVFHYHTMKISELNKYIATNKITIKKI